MEIKKEKVKSIGKLGGLDLDEEKLENLKEELEDILDYADKLSEFESDLEEDIEEGANFRENDFKEDEVVNYDWNSPKELLDQAEETKGDYFKTDQII